MALQIRTILFAKIKGIRVEVNRSKPPQSTCAMCILPPPSWGYPVRNKPNRVREMDPAKDINMINRY